jgi:peptidoglycan DL-endopeptidase LytF
MSRRDTILFAVLINVGLLVVLFVTAMKPEGEEGMMVASSEQAVEQIAEDVVSTEVASEERVVGDEVDQLLNQLSSRPIEVEKPIAKVIEVERPQKQSSDKDFIEITVKRGDVLGRIARTNGVSVDDIMKSNKLVSSRLSIGQVLQIPVKKEAPVAKAATTAPSAEDIKYYTVRSGDNPWLIAMRNRLDLQELLRLNDLDEEKARRLKPGDKLRVR